MQPQARSITARLEPSAMSISLHSCGEALPRVANVMGPGPIRVSSTAGQQAVA